jgi:hypothetical protein
MFHQEADGIAATAAAKAFIDLFYRGDSKGRGLLIMKGTKPQVIGAPLLKPHEAAYDLDDVYPAEYLLYGLLGDHDVCAGIGLHSKIAQFPQTSKVCPSDEPLPAVPEVQI